MEVGVPGGTVAAVLVPEVPKEWVAPSVPLLRHYLGNRVPLVTLGEYLSYQHLGFVTCVPSHQA